ncbi:MAG: methylated-DNA--[protein]-cysteine S-methyltransferase [Actinobacteria bacterium]|nr:methylated-DNA--[protein]-cysteine S-methyltransferase [Actinomycetota bacterium]
MKEPSTTHDAERLAGVLRETAARIEPRRDSAVLVDDVVAGVTDSFFGADSPIGTVYVAFGPDGVRYLAPAASEEEFARRYRERFGRFVVPAARERGEDLAEKVAAALAGERVEVPLDLSRTTPFQRRVLETVRGIARGEVRPYVWVAREAGSTGASRAVGNVMANNPIPLIVPCHRVVRNDGRTGSYAFGAGEKVRLLKMEGVSPEEISGAPYVATPTTGIVCHATCRDAKRIQPENRRPFRSVREATEAGYRPCKVCRPVAAA